VIPDDVGYNPAILDVECGTRHLAAAAQLSASPADWAVHRVAGRWKTDPMVTNQAGAQRSLVTLIDSYCRRTCRAVLDQHPGSSVSSPLGIWLLLAACSTAASGDNQRAIEEALGCTAAEATTLLSRFLKAPPPALHSALALWVRSADRTSPLVDWSSTLPPQVKRGPIPSQKVADAWADRHTMGLINRFPLITEVTRLVLASALATKVTWQERREVVSAAEHVRSSSPWADRVQNVLLDRSPVVPFMLARTEAAGVVAVHFAVATESLAVVSVASDPTLDRAVAFEAAYEIAERCRDDDLAGARCSLFDLPVGEGHSWQITEEKVRSYTAGEHSEAVESAVLAAWSVRGDLDLKRGGFGIEPALDALLGLLGPSPLGDESDAIQSAIASYTPTGFEAAAFDVLTLSTGTTRPMERGLERRARLIFDHPYAAIALAGTTSDFKRARAGHTDMFCLPLFSVWVAEPGEPGVKTGRELAPFQRWRIDPTAGAD